METVKCTKDLGIPRRKTGFGKEKLLYPFCCMNTHNFCFILQGAPGEFSHQVPPSCLHAQGGSGVLPGTPSRVQSNSLLRVHSLHHSFLYVQLSLQHTLMN